MKRLLIAVSLCLAICLPVIAQQSEDTAATREDIERYLKVMNSHDMMQQMMDAMAKPMHQMVHQQFLRDRDKLPPDFEQRMTRMMDQMLHDMPMDEMMQAMIPAYQKHLTKHDVNELITFYSSPTGQKILREMPAMLADAMQSAMPVMQNYVEKVQSRVQQETAEMLKESSKKSGAAVVKN